MDCCGSSKLKETDKDIKSDQTGNEKKPAEKEQIHGGGCCGGGSGMWLHLIIMIIAVLVISYFIKR